MADINIEDAIEKVDEILTPAKFNLADVIKGKAYPQDSIRIYLDEEAVYELNQLNGQLEGLARHKDPSEVQDLYDSTRAQADECAERLVATSLKITLQGQGHSVYDLITKQVAKEYSEDDEQRAHVENVRIIASSIVSIENGDGAIDGDRKFTEEEIEQLFDVVPVSEWTRVLELLYSLAFANTYFDRAVDAGFLSRR